MALDVFRRGMAGARSIGKKWVHKVSAAPVNAVAATLTTAVSGTNNDMDYTAKVKGVSGNSITIAYVVAGLSTALSVSVTGTAITVNVATDGAGAATSTAAQVKTAIDASPAASALVSVANSASNNGTGAVAAMGATALANGVNGTVGLAWEHRFYGGYVYLAANDNGNRINDANWVKWSTAAA